MRLNWFRKPTPQINDALWLGLQQRFRFTRHLDPADRDRLRNLCERFLREKTFSGARSFEVTPEIRVAIALQACLPVLNLGLTGYSDFVEIIVYPAQFRVSRSRTDEAGVVHESLEDLAGEAMEGGPVVLSWEDIEADLSRVRPRVGASNLTIHEFVHKLDLADGEPDGVPPLPRTRRMRWQQVQDAAYSQFCDALEQVERSIPIDIDPESSDADPWFATLPLDSYAATDLAEFFAVSGEAFFVDPQRLQQAFPDWYQELAAFFRQDPLSPAKPSTSITRQSS